MSAAQPAPNRRAMLGGSLALASVLAASAAPPAAASASAHPDAALLDLGAQLVASEDRRAALNDIVDETLDRFEAPPIPSGACFQNGDCPSICVDPHRQLACYDSPDGPVWVYEEGSRIDTLRADLAEWEAEAADAHPWMGLTRKIARAKEILAAVDLRAQQTKAAEDACGFTAAQEAEAVALAVVKRIQGQIVGLRATTTEGLAVKARVALEHWSFSPDYLASHVMPRLASETAAAADKGLGKAAVLSLVLDVLKLAPPPIKAEVAA